MEQHQVVIIGAGPGGYRAAFMAADLGMQVTLIDPQANPGGVCLYRGCIPTKALLHLAKVKEEAMRAGEWGLTFQEPKIDREKVKNWKESVVERLTGGLGQLTKTRKINYIQGWARFVDPTTLGIEKIEKNDKIEKTGQSDLNDHNNHNNHNLQLKFEHLIIATGAVPVKLPFIKEFTDRIMNAEIALELKSIPKRLLVLGGGYIGMESATIYKALGSEVSLVEVTPTIMPTMDPELVGIYLRQNKELFAEAWFETKVTALEESEGKVVVTLERVNREDVKDVKDVKKEFDAVLVSVGMRPNTEGLDLEKAGIEVDERGFIKADEQGRTNVKNIFAIGDVSGGMLLAHKASYQGRIAAEVIAGQKSAFDARAIPAVVYTDPEIAVAGLSEQECKEKNISFRIVKFPWAASGRAVAMGEPVGLTKLIIEEGTERILGAGIVGKNAGDLISEAVLGIEMAARASDMALSIHPHPTVSETLMEAAELYYGHPVHIAPPKRRPI
ncbi:MAG: dihydrolipoyl dehydrogenase [Porphyromonadaceae bacterium]|nr:MAG: dihydrolipoyl dehydrogenase [Porphyromonadaceae bacterium]